EQIRAQKYIAAIEILEKAKVRVGESPELKELLQFARERATELQRDDLIHNVLSRAQTLLQDEHFEEAVQVLEQAQGELKGEQITDALTSARNELQLFERRRGEIIASALHLLQTGEAARAVALFESARKVYFKNEEFQRAYSQCRQNLERASSIRNAEEEVEKSLAKEDIASAESVLEQALKVYADEPTLLTLKKRVQEESLRLRRYHLSERLGEAQVALGRMDYKRTIELLAPVLQESADIPELAKQAKFLQQEAERRGREAGVPQLDLRAALRGPAAGAKSEAVFAPIAAKKSRTILWVGAGAVIFVLAVIGAWRYFAGGGGAPGDLQLTAAPWAEVVSVKTASGQNMNITGETPMLLSLPAGQYVIELKNGQAKGELKVEVGAGKPTVVNYSFPEVKIDDLVQELVSK
ncbi:MAG: hypothetical protein ACRD50_06965, partial [Candidatus Acidiferrales bacterium]